jgi:hypothetical protein
VTAALKIEADRHLEHLDGQGKPGRRDFLLNISNYPTLIQVSAKQNRWFSGRNNVVKAGTKWFWCGNIGMIKSLRWFDPSVT